MAMVLGFFVLGVGYNSAVLCSGAGVSEWGGYSDTETLLTLAGQVDVCSLERAKIRCTFLRIFAPRWKPRDWALRR